MAIINNWKLKGRSREDRAAMKNWSYHSGRLPDEQDLVRLDFRREDGRKLVVWLEQCEIEQLADLLKRNGRRRNGG